MKSSRTLLKSSSAKMKNDTTKLKSRSTFVHWSSSVHAAYLQTIRPLRTFQHFIIHRQKLNNFGFPYAKIHSYNPGIFFPI
jgi:hypothetical protein